MPAKFHYFWSAVQKFGSQLIGFGGNILIARELSPDDYGLIAMLSIFINISMSLAESGFADFLIQKDTVDERDYNTVFVHNLVFGFILLILFTSSGPILVRFFKREELAEIAGFYGCVVVLRSLVLSEVARMRRNLAFKRLALLQILSSVISVVFGYFFAKKGLGYWALVIQSFSMSVTYLMLLILFNKWRPRLQFDWVKYLEMRSFGNKLIHSYLLSQIGSNLISVLTGKFDTSQNLGFYNQAQKINGIGTQGINSIVLTTSYSIIASEKDKSRRLELYRSVLSAFFALHFFYSFFLLSMSSQLIEFLLGEKWGKAAPLLNLTLIGFFVMPFTTLNSNIAKIAKRADLYRNMSLVRNALLIFSALLTYKSGIIVMLYGQIVARYLSVIYDIFIAGNLIRFRPIIQLSIALRQLVAPLMSFLLVDYYFHFGVLSFTYMILLFLVSYTILSALSNNFFYVKIRNYFMKRSV